MASNRSRAARVLLALALVLGLAVGMAPAQAGIIPGVVCNALASLQIDGTAPGPYTWTIHAASGNCIGDGNGPYVLTGDGTGTSDTLGFCDGLLVQNLDIDFVWNLFSLKNFQTTQRHENWFAPLSTFPIVTPYFVADGDTGTLKGAGAIFNRFGGACPPAGKPQSIVVEVRLT